MAERRSGLRDHVAIVLLFVFGLLFVRLGLWQLERADQKRALRERLAEGAVSVDETGSVAGLRERRYLPVRVRGTFLEPQVIIDHYPLEGRDGYLYVAAFRLAGRDEQVLVKRGWLPMPADRQPPEIALPSGTITIEARVEPVRRGYHFGLAAPGDKEGGLWAWLDPEYYSGHLHRVPVDIVLVQTNDTGDGLVRRWPPPSTDVSMHIGYAIQWFLFALVAFAVLGRLVWRRYHPGEPS